MQIIGIIPARYDSSRFPGKPLELILGKSMIQRVYEQASQAEFLSKVYVATDDNRIRAHVLSFGGNCVMTMPTHTTGTERCHEAIENLSETPDAVINIQGDEPFINPQQIDELIQVLKRPEVQIATLVKRIEDEEVLLNSNKVKVVLDRNNKALYFSRSPIPFYRDSVITEWLAKHDFYKHIGLYGYKSQTLREIVHLEQSALERAESLEQLRWIESGINVHCGITRHESPSVDTPSDLEEIERAYKDKA
jgi:3-deoxy-manno-octulosonate cytidylyltransferase (CMP-KDO synthetase)